jgi:hypothetical protein
MGGKRNVLYAHSNLVLFDQYNLDVLDPKRIKGKNIELVALSHKANLENGINFSERKVELAYIGRVIQFQKNVNFLMKASKHIDTKINV